jgi:RNA polymerase sigma factor (sigma-70 family)
MPVIRITAELWAEVMHSLKAGRKVPAVRAANWQAGVDALVVEHMPAAANIARKVWRDYTRSGQGGYALKIELSDMESCAYLGLVQAARRYDPSYGPFAHFAYKHVHGAIIDRYRRAAYRDMQHASIDADPERDEERKQFAAPPAGRRAPTDTPAELLREAQAGILASVWGLRAACRQVIFGLYFEELSATQLAQRMGISVAQVGVLRREGLAALRPDAERLAA